MTALKVKQLMCISFVFAAVVGLSLLGSQEAIESSNTRRNTFVEKQEFDTRRNMVEKQEFNCSDDPKFHVSSGSISWDKHEVPPDETTTIPFPSWSYLGDYQCQIPPRDQLLPDKWMPQQSKSRKLGFRTKPHTKKTGKEKIAFVLMEDHSVTFPAVWKQYFAGLSKDEYVLYIHLSGEKSLTQSMSLEAFNAQFPEKSVFDSTYNVRYLKTNTLAWRCHLMPIFLSFWNEAIQDDNVVGFVPISGHCLPMKSFTALYDALVVQRQERGLQDHAVLNYGDDQRTKSSMWGFYSRHFVERLLCLERALQDFDTCMKGGPDGRLKGGSEERCPSLMVRYLGLPSQHGVITFDCWDDDKAKNVSAQPEATTLFKAASRPFDHPAHFSSLHSSTLDALVESGAFFARKFSSSCLVVNEKTTADQYIISKVLH